MFHAHLTFQDGAAVTVPVEAGEALAEAAARLDLPMRHDCLSGECGACLCRATSGETTSDPTALLSPEEHADGLRLGCQTRLASDAAFELDYPLHPTPSAVDRYEAMVISLDRLNPTTSRLLLYLENAEDLTFAPGQYVRLRPPGLRVARPYSIASTPDALPEMELLIRHVAGGAISGWLEEQAEVGQTVRLQAPLGGFAIDDRTPRQIFIGGGTGLSPLLSMIRAAHGRTGRRLLCFGCTAPVDLFHMEELRALEAERPDLEVRIAVMRGAAKGAETGTAVDLLRREDLEPGCAVHLCGPPAMVVAAQQFLRKAGVATQAVRAERFAPRA
jgi:ferredoxin-NADP reductase/ferredoxin